MLKFFDICLRVLENNYILIFNYNIMWISLREQFNDFIESINLDLQIQSVESHLNKLLELQKWNNQKIYENDINKLKDILKKMKNKDIHDNDKKEIIFFWYILFSNFTLTKKEDREKIINYISF